MPNYNQEIDTNNPNNWSLIYNESFIADTIEQNGKTRYLPIPKIQIFNTTNSEYINVEITATYKQDTWDFGGNLSPVTSIQTSGNINEISLNNIYLYLGIGNLIQLQRTGNSNYRFNYYPPEWFRDTNIKIYEYVGGIGDNYIDLLNQTIDLINLLL